MNLELRKITHNVRLSEETPNYAADLYLDGKKVATVKNEGRGGCDFAHFSDRAVEALIAAHFKALPPVEADGMTLEQDLEMWCHAQLEVVRVFKSLKRSLAKKVIVAEGTKEVSWKGMTPAHLNDAFRAQVKQKFPNAVLLNDLNDEGLRAHVESLVS